MPSILRHRLPSTYRSARLPGLPSSCSAIFTVQSIWLTDCLQQLGISISNGSRTTSDHNHVCDISLVGSRANWVPRTVIAQTLRLFELSRPKKAEKCPLPPSACAGQSSHQLLLWLLGLCILMRSRSALNCADLPTTGPEVRRAQVLWGFSRTEP